jgi:hypothetical protein
VGENPAVLVWGKTRRVRGSIVRKNHTDLAGFKRAGHAPITSSSSFSSRRRLCWIAASRLTVLDDFVVTWLDSDILICLRSEGLSSLEDPPNGVWVWVRIGHDSKDLEILSSSRIMKNSLKKRLIKGTRNCDFGKRRLNSSKRFLYILKLVRTSLSREDLFRTII